MSSISTEEAFSQELTSLEKIYEQTTGQPMKKYYRPPQGKYSESNLKMAQSLGYKTFFWSLAYVDWYQDNQPSHEEAYKKLLGRIHPGAVVLLHSTSKTNAEILDSLLTKWEEMGYRFASLDELAASVQDAGSSGPENSQIFYPLNSLHRILVIAERRQSEISFPAGAEAAAGSSDHMRLLQQIIKEIPASHPFRHLKPDIGRVNPAVYLISGFLKPVEDHFGVAHLVSHLLL